MKIFLASIAMICTLISLAQASTASKMKLVGYVTAFDQNTVTIESGNQRFTIPRAMYPDRTKSGELISVPVTESEFASLKHQTTVKK
jgi:hypothetical protein